MLVAVFGFRRLLADSGSQSMWFQQLQSLRVLERLSPTFLPVTVAHMHRPFRQNFCCGIQHSDFPSFSSLLSCFRGSACDVWSYRAVGLGFGVLEPDGGRRSRVCLEFCAHDRGAACSPWSQVCSKTWRLTPNPNSLSEITLNHLAKVLLAAFWVFSFTFSHRG